MNFPNLCAPAQASQALQVPETRLARWRSKGCGPAYVKIEGRVSYTVESLIEFINLSTIRPSGTASVSNHS